jgi:hypothetical protein
VSLRQIITGESSRGAAAMRLAASMTIGMTTTTGPFGAGTG